MKEKLKAVRRKHIGKRALTITLAVLMVITSVNWPENVLSARASGLEMCPNHLEHTAECGYVEAVEGHPVTMCAATNAFQRN